MHIPRVVKGVEWLPENRLLVKCYSEMSTSDSAMRDWAVGEAAFGGFGSGVAVRSIGWCGLDLKREAGVLRGS